MKAAISRLRTRTELISQNFKLTESLNSQVRSRIMTWHANLQLKGWVVVGEEGHKVEGGDAASRGSETRSALTHASY